VDLDRRIVRAPEFPPCTWVNTPSPVALPNLRDHIVLIDIWDFTCINCLRVLPYLRAWYERYNDFGFEIIGVHTPEFSFAHNPDLVAAASKRLGIRWPVVLDNEQAIWTAYANRYWPSLYLLDGEGYVRYRHTGEGAYAQTETAIQALLMEIDPSLSLPAPLPPLRPEDTPGAMCSPTTPELHADAMGNAEPSPNGTLLISSPADVVDKRFYLDGKWRTQNEGITLLGDDGTILLPYQAASVNAVLSPSPDPVDISLLKDDPVLVEIIQDGAPLPPDQYGEDTFLDLNRALVRIDAPRMYALVQNSDVRPRELRLKATNPGLTFYAFSFGSCLAPRPPNHNQKKE
jgi:thiol-disulfide isomerase/thioredoxin